MLLAYPDADLFVVCDFLQEKHRGLLVGRTPITTFIQRLPFASKKHWQYLPLMPVAIEQLQLQDYDVIVSSSYCVAKGVLTGPDQTHLCYIHTPVRYAWHLQHQYLEEMGLTRGVMSAVVRAVLHYMRMWDLRSAVGVTKFVANSGYVAKQVTQLYKQPCEVLHPPVDLKRFTLQTQKDDYYVAASRLVPYKRVDLIVRAFIQMPHRRLRVIGSGAELKHLQETAAGHSNIEIMGYRPDAEYTELVSRARAFVFAAIEDFGIATVEAQACGTPVIALGRGGSLEIVRRIDTERPTGVLYFEQTEEAIIEAVEEFEREEHLILPVNCRKNAERFAASRFRESLMELVDDAVAKQTESMLDLATIP